MVFKDEALFLKKNFLQKELKNKIRIAFENKDFEKAYVKRHRKDNLFYTRIAMIAGLLIYGLFGFIDPTIAGDDISFYRFIRYGLVSSMGLIIFLFSFYKPVLKIISELFTFGITVGGISVILMSRLGSQPESFLYDLGVLLVMMYGCILSRLRFYHTVFICFSLIIAYFFINSLNTNTPNLISLHGAFNIIAGAVIGLSGNYIMEKYSRKNYVQSKIIEHMAETDSLTGLHNRRKFELDFKKILKSFKKNKTIVLIYLDVDSFKEINDTHGHNVGDKILILLAQAIEKELDKKDIAARMGGDEFALILPKTEISQAITIIERILKNLEQVKIDQKSFVVKFSAGYTALKKNDNIESALKRADKNLYAIKKQKNHSKNLKTSKKL